MSLVRFVTTEILSRLVGTVIVVNVTAVGLAVALNGSNGPQTILRGRGDALDSVAGGIKG